MNVLRFIAIFAALLVFFPPSSLRAAPPVARDGVMDLSGWDLEREGPVDLFGSWEFYFEQFVPPDLFGSPNAPPPRHTIAVPSLWNGYDLDGRTLTGHGYATYHLHVKGRFKGRRLGLHVADILNSYRLYVNGREVASVGSPGRTAAETVPGWIPVVTYFEGDSDDLDLVLHIANFHHREGGTWAFFSLGSAHDISAIRDRSIAIELFLFGSIFVMAIYHLGLFVMRPEDRSSLYFGLFCFLISLRVLLQGERILASSFPGLSFEVLVKAEYLTIALAVPAFTSYMRNLFEGAFDRRVFLGVEAVFYGFTGLILVTPVRVFSHISIPMQGAMIVVGAFLVYGIVRAMRLRKDGAVPALGSMLFLSICVINDILYTRALIQTANVTSVGTFIFLLLQSFIISGLSARAFKGVEILSRELGILSSELSRTNDSYSRFVPREFLEHLKKKDVTDIQLGDQIQAEMTVLFCDIRSFTSMSEKMTPQENFDFLNDYLGRMSPIIRECGGFVDKFIGDAVMALFPASPGGAIEAAVRMQRAVKDYNAEPARAGNEPLRIGIGIHCGMLTLGTIGERNRMEGTVISDAVNLASRLQDLTKRLRSSIILSEAVYERLEDGSQNGLRYLGAVRVKGKSRRTQIYEIFADEHEAALRNGTRDRFQAAVAEYCNRNYRAALEGFVDVARSDPTDRTALFYLEKSGSAIVNREEAVTEGLVGYIPWSAEFETSIAAIDEQHRGFLHILNRLSALKERGAPGDEAVALLERLQIYALTHFALEEALMARNAYAGLDAHVAEHRAFSTRIMDSVARIHRGESFLLDDLAGFLSDWFVRHIQTVDRAYVPSIDMHDSPV